MNKDEKLAKALGKNLFEKIYSQVDEMPEELMSDKEKEFIEEFGLTNGFVNKIKQLGIITESPKTIPVTLQSVISD